MVQTNPVTHVGAGLSCSAKGQLSLDTQRNVLTDLKLLCALSSAHLLVLHPGAALKSNNWGLR